MAPRRKFPNLPELLEEALTLCTVHGYALPEILEANETFARYRYLESADAYGLPNVGFPVCVLRGGSDRRGDGDRPG